MAFLLLLPLPGWALLVVCVPILAALSASNVLPNLAVVGEADIRLSDAVLLVAALKILGLATIRRRRGSVHRVHLGIALYFVVLFVTTAWALRFGREIFASEVLALFRIIAESSVILLLERAMQAGHLVLMNRLMQYAGLVLPIPIFLGVALRPLGFQLGEVQAADTVVRYFGLIGDQVGLLLVFFILLQVLTCRTYAALLSSIALLATGSIGPLIVLAIGLGMIARPRNFGWKLSTAALRSLAIVGITGLLALAGQGAVRARFLDAAGIEFSVAQRLTTIGLAVQVFRDSIFTGVGFTGFRFLAHEYGAESAFVGRLGGFSPVYIATTSNQLLQVATDGGLLGLLAFLPMVATALATLKRSAAELPREGSAVFLAGYLWVLALLIGNQTSVWILPGSPVTYLFWLILGAALAARGKTNPPTSEARAKFLSGEPQLKSTVLFVSSPRTGMVGRFPGMWRRNLGRINLVGF